MEEHKKIVIVSDGTGGTARRLMDAVLVQYDQTDHEYSIEQTYQQVRTRKEVDRILRTINDEYLILYSIISKELSDHFHERLTDRGILHLNVLQPMLDIVSKFLGVHPGYHPGILQIVDDRYYKKIDAIGFTVEHDDGGGSRIDEADAVLLGLSRSCKTPISMYLACNHGLKVANIPVIRDADITSNMLLRLESVDQEKIVGLLVQPQTLAHIREERTHYLAADPESQAGLLSYYDIKTVAQEFRFCRDLYLTKDWKTIDVTRRAIEEVSVDILRQLDLPCPDTAM